jgi:hypothetical protein
MTEARRTALPCYVAMRNSMQRVGLADEANPGDAADAEEQSPLQIA